MIYQPDNNVMSSFELWFNDHLLRNGQAFTNISGNLALSNEPNISDNAGNLYQSWIMPNTQWAYDYTISGVVVPNSAVVNGNSTTSIKIDTEEGKIWVPTEATAATVSAAVSVKDIEVRVSSASEENILFSDNPSQRYGDASEAVPNEVGFPYVYLKYSPGRSQAIGFGGFQITKFQIRAVMVTDDEYLFDGMNILFRDISETYFSILQPQEFPFDEFGTLKSGVFDYRGTIATNPSRPIYYIKEVTTSPFQEEINSRIAKNAIGGFIDFKIESLGYPHARFV